MCIGLDMACAWAFYRNLWRTSVDLPAQRVQITVVGKEICCAHTELDRSVRDEGGRRYTATKVVTTDFILTCKVAKFLVIETKACETF